MKSKNYILSVLAIGLMTGSMVSCSDFLDTKPSTSVDDTDVFQTTSGAQSALNGCYYQMRAYGSGELTGVTTTVYLLSRCFGHVR